MNLLVGQNNSGKTSLLEAIQLLCSRYNLDPMIAAMARRGEYLWDEDKRSPELDICHIFYNHQIEIGSNFSLSGIKGNREDELIATIIELRENIIINNDNQSLASGVDDLNRLGFNVTWKYGDKPEKSWNFLLYNSNGGLALAPISMRRLKTLDGSQQSEAKTQFVTSSALTSEKMIELFDRIVLTPEEKLVIEAIQTIEPKIERIAPISSERYRRSEAREGFMVLLSDTGQRVPIGSMGDGTWRMLGLALATVGAADGFLFVDEIDTGLHFSTMADMWRLIWETAKRLNVQVFATTHSSDCWMSLASIASEEEETEDGITIQRIERDKGAGIGFSGREIVIAANRGIEVR
ncbi:MAG: AAA family ATPase [Oscillatoriaceae cyanobacterium]